MLLEDAPAEADPLRAVVVACDEDDRDARADDKPSENVVQQRDSIGGRHRAVIDIASDDDSVDMLRSR